MTVADASADQRPLFRRRHRVSRDRDYQRVYQAGLRKTIGPLTFRALPNALGVTRFGMTVPRRVGKAVVRVRIKRLLREAFRLERPALPTGYDVVVTVRPHEPATLETYRSAVRDAVANLDRRWRREGGAR